MSGNGSEIEEIGDLAKAMARPEPKPYRGGEGNAVEAPTQEYDGDENDLPVRRYVHWTSHDGKMFIPAAQVQGALNPGLYEVAMNPNIGLHFVKVDVSTEDLIRFKDTNIDAIMAEIQAFWGHEDRYKRYNLPHKRGLLMWGPQGTGKTSAIALVMRDVVQREGVVIKFTHPDLFIHGMRILREIQPDTPVVVIMEDLDESVREYSESQITNILDGNDRIEKVVFLATTNYPGNLGARIVNRPSRFDRVFKIGNLSPENRKIYLDHLFIKGELSPDDNGHDLNQWVEETDALSISHIKELFTSVVIYGQDYEIVIKRLRAMQDEISEQEGPMGFGAH